MTKKIAFKVQLFLLTFLLSFNSASPMLLSRSEAVCRHNVGEISVVHDKAGFSVIRNGVRNRVKNYNVAKEIRNISTHDLSYFLGRRTQITVNGVSINLVKTKLESVPEDMPLVSFSEDASNELDSYFSNGYITVNQSDDGEYTIDAHMRLIGGGPFGAMAGAWAGKFIASVVCHGAIAIAGVAVSVVATPAAGAALVMGLEGSLGTTIEATTTAVALAGGIAGGVATGPV